MNRFADSLLIIIVIYNRPLEACESFQSVLEMPQRKDRLAVFVYDNSQTPQQIGHYEGLTITYFHDPQNSGVGKAYNTGVAQADKNQMKWVLLLDQDTRLPESILENYQRAITVNPNLKLFVPILKLKNGKIFSPFRYWFKRGFYLNSISPGKHSFRKVAPVNSGIMVRVEEFLRVGGYNEKVKLDFSDFQFIERFRKHQSDFYVLDVTCLQDFSDDDISYQNQKLRFRYFCEGAKNVEKQSIYEWFQYNLIVFFRALKLTLRYGRPSFFRTYLRRFMFAADQ